MFGEALIKTKNQEIIDISRLPNAVYTIRISTEKTIYYQKIIKQ